MDNRRRTSSSERTFAAIVASGIGSFLLVLFFPRGIKYFFRHGFPRMVRNIVIVSLAGLFTEKIAQIASRYARTTQRPPR